MNIYDMVGVTLNLVIQILVCFGLIFFDYLVISIIDYKKSTGDIFNKYSPIWLILILSNLLFLNHSHCISLELMKHNLFIGANAHLQLVILFYFLYMLDGLCLILTNVIAALGITVNYILGNEVNSIHSYLVAMLGTCLVCFVSYIIKKNKKSWVENFTLYFISEMFFALAWSLIFAPVIRNVENFWIFICLFIATASVLHFANIVVRRQLNSHAELVNEVTLDFLTQLKNRRAFEKTFTNSFQAFKEMGQPETFVILDIDNFKLINDTYGHDAGDFVIKSISRIIKHELLQRSHQGQAFRLGGEEFGIIFRNFSAHQVVDEVLEVLLIIKNNSFKFKGNEMTITLSAGISDIKEADASSNDLYTRADYFLYNSKIKGKSSITMDEKIIKY